MNKRNNILTALVAVLMLSACSPTRKLDKIHDKHPDATAQRCAIWFPPKDSVTIETRWTQGEIDTIYGDTVRVVKDNYVDRIIKVPIPKIIKRTDTVTIETVKYEENMARVYYLTNVNDSFSRACRVLENNIGIVTKQRNYCGIGLILIIVIGLILRYFKL